MRGLFCLPTPVHVIQLGTHRPETDVAWRSLGPNQAHTQGQALLAGQNAASASSTALHITFPLRRSASCASSPCALTAPSITAANLSTNAADSALVQLSIHARPPYRGRHPHPPPRRRLWSHPSARLPTSTHPGGSGTAPSRKTPPRPRATAAAPLCPRMTASRQKSPSKRRSPSSWAAAGTRPVVASSGQVDVQAVLRGGGEVETGFEEAGFALDVDERVDNPREQRRGGILPLASERPPTVAISRYIFLYHSSLPRIPRKKKAASKVAAHGNPAAHLPQHGSPHLLCQFGIARVVLPLFSKIITNYRPPHTNAMSGAPNMITFSIFTGYSGRCQQACNPLS
ncbi:hypothetical protein MY1884_004535 [Beauveria asiatica]